MPFRYQADLALGKERSQSRILADLLTAVKEETRTAKTRMMQRACLDWNCFKRHFAFLLDRGFIAECSSMPGRYELTAKGAELLRLQKAFYRLCGKDA